MVSLVEGLRMTTQYVTKCARRRRASAVLLAMLLVFQCTLTAVLLRIRNAGRYSDGREGNLTGRPPAFWIYSDSRSRSGSGGINLLEMFISRKSTPLPKPLPQCPDQPPDLQGHVDVTYERLQWRELEQLHPEVEAGGRWRPPHCVSSQHVAIIVPYRDRSDHLRVFLHHIHPFLQKQLIDYGIYVIEQDPYSPFNRGLLLNIGYKEAMADNNYTCAIFHDVDLLPEDDRNLYYCPDQPRHMSAAVDEFAYRLPYSELFGGIEAFSKEHFELINGFSNKYFGWGAEDDDLYKRIEWRGLNLTRYPMEIARYSMIRHIKNEPSPGRLQYLTVNMSRSKKDGLNSLQYDRKRFERRKLFTWIYARVNQTAILQQKSRPRKKKLKEA